MADCAQNCPLVGRMNALEGQVDELQTQNTQSHKEIFGRLNALEKSNAVQEVHYTAIMAQLGELKAEINLMAGKIDAAEKKPGTRWELIKTVAITAGVTATISAIVPSLISLLSAGGGIG